VPTPAVGRVWFEKKKTKEKAVGEASDVAFI
jgi:hypothetical protein